MKKLLIIFFLSLSILLSTVQPVMSNSRVQIMLLYYNWEQAALEDDVNTILGLAYISAYKDTYLDKLKALEYFNRYQTLVTDVNQNVIDYFNVVKQDIEMFEKYIKLKDE